MSHLCYDFSMSKPATKKPNGNVFKTVVRTVMREELGVVEKRLEKNLTQKIEEKIVDLKEDLTRKNNVLREDLKEALDASFRQYRDDVLTKLDEPIGKLKTTQEEQAAHQLQHENLSDIPDRVEKLEVHQHPQQSP